MIARFPGTDAVTGRRFEAGTRIASSPTGKGWIDVSRGCAECHRTSRTWTASCDSDGNPGVVCRYHARTNPEHMAFV